MRNSTAYFAGVATVFTAAVLGFSGAMIMTNAMAPRGQDQPTKLERIGAAQASISRDTKSATTAETGVSQENSPQASVPTTPAQLQPAASPSGSEQASSSSATPTQTAAQPPTSGADQSATNPQASEATNAFARGSDEEYRKYIRKRERHWAHRRNREDDAQPAAQATSSDQNSSSSTASQTAPTASSQPAQAQPAQVKTADQAPARVDDPNKAKRKRDRQWARSHSRDDDDGVAGDDRSRSFEVREMPPERPPQPLFDGPHWRPFFNDADDD